MRGSNDGQPAPVPEAPDGDFDFQGALGKFDKAAEMAKLSIHGDSTGAATAAAVAAPAAAAATGAEAAADEGTSKPQVAKVRCAAIHVLHTRLRRRDLRGKRVASRY